MLELPLGVSELVAGLASIFFGQRIKKKVGADPAEQPTASLKIIPSYLMPFVQIVFAFLIYWLMLGHPIEKSIGFAAVFGLMILGGFDVMKALKQAVGTFVLKK